jgi:hypothetical protein
VKDGQNMQISNGFFDENAWVLQYSGRITRGLQGSGRMWRFIWTAGVRNKVPGVGCQVIWGAEGKLTACEKIGFNLAHGGI